MKVFRGNVAFLYSQWMFVLTQRQSADDVHEGTRLEAPCRPVISAAAELLGKVTALVLS